MERNSEILNAENKVQKSNRREFLNKGVMVGAIAGISGLTLLNSCKEVSDEGISPAEDLMREHGLLNRILLIYDRCKLHLAGGEQFPPETLLNSAMIIRKFIEEYHEKLEEEFLFPRFIKAGQLVDLVQVLKNQHSAGRDITGQIINLLNPGVLPGNGDRQKLITLLDEFIRMYRPHEAREDTILFPGMRKVIPDKDYYALGDDFEEREHDLFGEEGFEKEVEKVAGIEKQLDIYDLAAFTPVRK